jgi:hypothetical protein
MWILLMLWACGAQPSADAPSISSVPTAEPAPAPPSPPSRGPLSGARAVAPVPWEGRIVEVVPAGSYVYMYVERADGLRWVGTLGMDAAPGQVVSVRPLAEVDRYDSARAGRRFEDLLLAYVTVLAES